MEMLAVDDNDVSNTWVKKFQIRASMSFQCQHAASTSFQFCQCLPQLFIKSMSFNSVLRFAPWIGVPNNW